MKSMVQRLKLRLINFWPPFLGAGIRVTRRAPDFSFIEAEMKLTPLNRNYVGTQFGGSLYAMTDPFFMLILMEKLGPDYVVWDKAATIRFLKPGRGRVRARFEIAPDQIESFRQRLETERKIEPVFSVKIFDDAGEPIAEVEKLLYIRKRKKAEE